MLANRKIILLILLIAATTVSAYILIVVIPGRVAANTYNGVKTLAEDFRKAFQFTPEVKVDNLVVLQYRREILELAVLTEQFRHEYNWRNSWMGSTKTIQITGTFEAKAGFDLDEKFELELSDAEAVVRLPHAQLLSVTPGEDLVFRDENGVWNWVNNQERSEAINAFNRNAKLYANNSALMRDAEREMEKRVAGILRSHGKKVTFVYQESAIIKKEGK